MRIPAGKRRRGARLIASRLCPHETQNLRKCLQRARALVSDCQAGKLGEGDLLCAALTLQHIQQRFGSSHALSALSFIGLMQLNEATKQGRPDKAEKLASGMERQLATAIEEFDDGRSSRGTDAPSNTPEASGDESDLSAGLEDLCAM